MKSSERSIFRLAFHEVAKQQKTKDIVTKKKQKPLPGPKLLNAAKQILHKAPRTKFNIFSTRRIKLISDVIPLNTRCLSTTAVRREFVPILNPNKPNPEDSNEVAPPIRPLMNSSFGKAKSNPIPSVTKVLQATMPAASRFLLERWKESMIKKLGLAGFAKYQSETFARGTALHSILAKYLIDKIEPSPDHTSEDVKLIVENLWKSINHLVRDKMTNVRLVEHIVTHPELNYRGIVDCVAFYNDELVVIDFKTAEKPKHTKESLYDNPLQITAYCGAINRDPNIPINAIDRNICSGLIITAYTDGSAATLHQFSRDEINSLWKQWIDRLDQYTRLQDMTQAKYKTKVKG